VARLATNRDTYLEPEEIAAEALRQFDAGGDVSIRQLASALQVSPAAIYHHFESRDDIVLAALGLVWEEVFAQILTSTTDFVPDDPRQFLIDGALATRRVFGRHYQIARLATMTPKPDPRLSGGLAILGVMFERLGLNGEQAGAALWAFATYTIGSILISASRRYEDDHRDRPAESFSSIESRPADAPVTSVETGESIDHAVFATGHDFDDEERFFLAGLESLFDGLLLRAAAD
jgi:AcrR family transcriptional regulator